MLKSAEHTHMKRYTLAFFLLLSIVAGYAITQLMRQERPHSSTAAIAEGQPALIVNQAHSTALPPADVPLASIYNDLSSRAKDGDGNAAMRLFSDLTKCKNRNKLMAQVNHLSFPGGKNSANGGVAHPELVDKNLKYLNSTDSLCAGVKDDAIEARGDFLRQAALDGNSQAMVCYAKSTQEVGPDYLTNSWFDYADRWIQEAPYFAQQAFERGQADAIPLLIDAYVPEDPSSMKRYQFNELVSPDIKTAYGLALLYERLVPPASAASVEAGKMADLLKSKLSPGEQLEAEKFADANWPNFEKSAGSEKNVDPCFGAY